MIILVIYVNLFSVMPTLDIAVSPMVGSGIATHTAPGQ